MKGSKVRVLLVEDNQEDVDIIRRLLSQYDRAQFEVTSVASTNQCIETLESREADLLLLDYGLPGDDGLAFLRRLSGILCLPPVIVITGQGSERVAAEAIRCGAFGYLAKDSLTPELLGRTAQEALQNLWLEEELSPFDQQMVYALAAAAEGKDMSMRGHLERITRYAMVLGQALRLDDDQLLTLRCGALLHDIGKLAMSTALLRKPGPLTSDEWADVRRHPLAGERICEGLKLSSRIGPIVRHHHERWDGSGVVDAFDAMTSDRPYRRALPVREALRRLRAGVGTQWDGDIVHTFLELVEREGLSTKLSALPQGASAN